MAFSSSFPVSTSAAPQNQKRAGISDCLTSGGVPQVQSGSSNFTQAILPFNLRLPFTPVAVAIPTTVAQVQAAVKCGTGNGITISARSGGHSYASHGLGGEDGHLMIDMKLFNNVTLDDATNIATIGPGARLGNVAVALFEQGGRAISHGICPGVGMGGHVLYGGYGMISHTHGLALDNMVEATVVLADGTLATASESENSDLFWALRGAGPSYGIITSMKFQTFAAPPSNIVFSYSFAWTQAQARAAFEVVQKYVSSDDMPREMNFRMVINANSTTVSGVFYGTRADYDAAVAPLLAGLNKTALGSISTKGWIESLEANAHGSLETPLDYAAHETFFAKSLMPETLNAAAMDAFVDYWYTTARTITRDWYVIIDAHGGPTSYISSIAPDATAYAHRKAVLKYQFYDRARSGAYPSTGFSFLNGWIDAVQKAMPDTDLGMYINYADDTLTAAEAHNLYWLQNYARLETIKDKFDPGSVFSNPQAINST